MKIKVTFLLYFCHFFTLFPHGVHPVREQGKKVTKIQQKSYFDFHTYYCLNFCFPKKVSYFIYAKKNYEPLSIGYFFHILTLIWEYIGIYRGAKNWWVCKHMPADYRKEVPLLNNLPEITKAPFLEGAPMIFVNCNDVPN